MFAIESTKGKFFTATIRKSDGTIRTINARTGVKKHLRGGGVPVGHVSTRDDMLVVYDVKVKGYRTIVKDNILSVKFRNVVYTA